MYDITYTSIGAAVVEDFYDENVVFLRFCFEKELLKKNPLGPDKAVSCGWSISTRT